MLANGAKLFTFHYVSILILTHRHEQFHPDVVYIPLCLYFNRRRRRTRSHSTYVYIPLCLYFNAEFSYSGQNVYFVYIPLCLYFNLKQLKHAAGTQ